MLSFFPLDVLDEIWDLTESVSEGFLTYSFSIFSLFLIVNNYSNFEVNIFSKDRDIRKRLILSENSKSKKENPQKLTQLSSRSHPRHLVGKRTTQKDTIIDITSDSQVNSNFPYRWSPASLTFNNYFYLI